MYLCERMNFRQLLAFSEPKRKARARHVRGPSLKLETGDDSNYYHFNFRSYPSTTGQRHVGYVRFLKPPDDKTPLQDIDCEVDCDCPDFKYRFAWADKQRGASQVGPSSYNKAHNRAPRITNPTNQPGLCKHLIAVRDYLSGLVYKMPKTLKAPERLGRLVTLTNRSVINPDKSGGAAEPVIADQAPFRASPAQQSSPKFPSRARVEPAISATAAAKRAERERELSVARQRREGPRNREMPPELPVAATKPKKQPEPGWSRGIWSPQAVTTKNRRNQTERDYAVVKHMNKIYEEAVAALDGAADALPPSLDGGADGAGIIPLLGEIRDLLKDLLTGFGGDATAAPAKDGFDLPDNATKVDLTSGEPEGEPDALDEIPSPEDLTNNNDRVDLEADDEEGVEGGPDDEDEN